MKFQPFKDEIIRLYHDNIALFTISNKDSIYVLAHQYQSQLSVSIIVRYKQHKYDGFPPIGNPVFK